MYWVHVTPEEENVKWNPRMIYVLIATPVKNLSGDFCSCLVSWGHRGKFCWNMRDPSTEQWSPWSCWRLDPSDASEYNPCGSGQSRKGSDWRCSGLGNNKTHMHNIICCPPHLQEALLCVCPSFSHLSWSCLSLRCEEGSSGWPMRGCLGWGQCMSLKEGGVPRTRAGRSTGFKNQERSLRLLIPQACKHCLPIRGIRVLRKPSEAGRGESWEEMLWEQRGLVSSTKGVTLPWGV